MTRQASSLQSHQRAPVPCELQRCFFATIVEVSGSSPRSFAAKNPVKIQGKHALEWQRTMLLQGMGTTEPSPQSRGDHGALLIIPCPPFRDRV